MSHSIYRKDLSLNVKAETVMPRGIQERLVGVSSLTDPRERA